MKKLALLVVVMFGLFTTANAQDKMMKKEVKIVSLEQTTGEFTQKQITLSAGTYVFEIANSNVDHNVGFVLAPKSNPDAHIKNAYVTSPVATGTKETSKEVTLAKGEYVYFCPLNPTPQYTLVVE